MLRSKRVRIMAGPNGSGKSTVLKAVYSQFYSGLFVNADEIEKTFKSKGFVNLLGDFNLEINDSAFTEFLKGLGNSWITKAKKEKSNISLSFSDGILSVKKKPTFYDAAVAADFIRHTLIEKNETFTFETVLSHPSKIDFLKHTKNKGFKNYLYFICTVDPEINKNRETVWEKLEVTKGGKFCSTACAVEYYNKTGEIRYDWSRD
jgi:predicted ABC-type ATPase